MASVMSASGYIMSESCYYPRYQSRSSMYILGLILWNFAELAEAVPIDLWLRLPDMAPSPNNLDLAHDLLSILNGVLY